MSRIALVAAVQHDLRCYAEMVRSARHGNGQACLEIMRRGFVHRSGEMAGVFAGTGENRQMLVRLSDLPHG
jgi:hypothetical protein